MAISVGMGGMVIIIRSLLFGMGDNIPAGVATRRGNLRFNAFGKTKGKRCSVASPLPTKTFFVGALIYGTLLPLRSVPLQALGRNDAVGVGKAKLR